MKYNVQVYLAKRLRHLFLLPLQGAFSFYIHIQGAALSYKLLAFLALQLVLSLEKSMPLFLSTSISRALPWAISYWPFLRSSWCSVSRKAGRLPNLLILLYFLSFLRAWADGQIYSS